MSSMNISPPRPSPPLKKASTSGLATILTGFPVTSPPESIDPGDDSAQGSSKRKLSRFNASSTLNIPLQYSGSLRRTPSAQGTTWSNDDGLSHLDIPRTFGEAAEYWKFYDELSDRHDKDMIKILNGNLDILLIFAGLFSAVNTAFIVISLGNLSSAPDAHMVWVLSILAQDRQGSDADLAPPSYSPSSQDVRLNSFLSASLSCSLLAAFGAVMAKQWVLHYARGTVGTLESQGRTRQRKLNGVAKYRFQNVVETLPILLQVSLILFFVGLLDFLHSLNNTVAFVVLAFAISGAAVYTITVFMASRDPQCPFQTPVSIFMRESLPTIRKGLWRSLQKLHYILRGRSSGMFMLIRIKKRGRDLEHGPDESQDLKRSVENDSTMDDHHKEEEASIDSQTACWIIETSEHKSALLSAARNIPSLRKIEQSVLNVDKVAFDRLFSLFNESLATWRASGGHSTPAQPGPFDTAVVYGRALCHSLIGSKGEGFRFTRRSHGLRWPHKKSSSGFPEANEFNLMKICMKAEVPLNFCISHSKDTILPSSSLTIYIAALLQPSLESNDRHFRIKAEAWDRFMLSQWLISLCLSHWHPEVCSPSAVSLAAWALSELPTLLPTPSQPIDETFRKAWWDAYTTEYHLFPHFIKALEVYPKYKSLQLNPQDANETIHTVKAPDYVYTYTWLVNSVRCIITGHHGHQAAVTDNPHKLKRILKQTIATVEKQRAATMEPDDHKCLDSLKEELQKTEESLQGTVDLPPQALDAHDSRAVGSATADLTHHGVQRRANSGPPA